MSVFALELIQEAVTAGGPAILHMPLLMRRLQVDLPESLLAPFRADAPPPETPGPRYLCDTLMHMTHVMLALYLILKRQFLLQVEVFIQVRPPPRPGPSAHAPPRATSPCMPFLDPSTYASPPADGACATAANWKLVPYLVLTAAAARRRSMGHRRMRSSRYASRYASHSMLCLTQHPRASPERAATAAVKGHGLPHSPAARAPHSPCYTMVQYTIPSPCVHTCATQRCAIMMQSCIRGNTCLPRPPTLRHACAPRSAPGTRRSAAAVQAVLLPLARGSLPVNGRSAPPPALVEAAHECLADFCVFPGFLQEAYAGLDCRVECSNLFEDITKARRHPCIAPLPLLSLWGPAVWLLPD